uniref:Uncharacterized protein n=1 Tax=Moniliophthora roreri TaxID=221103 RepID=A0A0W0FDA1_MONRR
MYIGSSSDHNTLLPGSPHPFWHIDFENTIYFESGTLY